jgi:hypothetical protein
MEDDIRVDGASPRESCPDLTAADDPATRGDDRAAFASGRLSALEADGAAADAVTQADQER